MNLEKRHLVPNSLRSEIIGMYRLGTKQKIISEMTGVPAYTVCKIIKRWETTGSVALVKPPGRPQIMTDRDLRQLDRVIKQNRRAPLRVITSEFNMGRERKVSERTIHRCLHKLGFNACVAVPKPLLLKKTSLLD